MGKVNIDEAIDLIIEGKTVREIAAHFNIVLSGLYKEFAKEEHSARVKDALILSSNLYADKAEEVLMQAKGNMVEITRARELAQHYRWKASKRAPKLYGDKLEIEGQMNHGVSNELLKDIAERIKA